MQQWWEWTRFSPYHSVSTSPKSSFLCTSKSLHATIFLLSCHTPGCATKPQYHHINQQLWNAAFKLLETLQTKKFIEKVLFCCMSKKSKTLQGGSCQCNVEGPTVTLPCDNPVHQGLNIVPWSRHCQFCKLSLCLCHLHLHITVAFNTFTHLCLASSKGFFYSY